MIRQNTITFILLTALAAIGAQRSASAAPVTWTLSNITFTDGGIATGSFTYDADTNIVSTWNITVSGGNTTSFPPFTYNPSDSSVDTPLFAFVLPPTDPAFIDDYRVLRLYPISPLTDAGGVVSLDMNPTDGSVECFNCGPYRPVTGGTLDATATPEPGSAILAGVPLLAGLIVLRRRVARALVVVDQRIEAESRARARSLVGLAVVHENLVNRAAGFGSRSLAFVG